MDAKLEKIKSEIISVLVILAGMVGAKTLKSFIPAPFNKYSDYTVAAVSLAGTIWGKKLVADVAAGGFLYAAINILNAFVPTSVAAYIPQFAGPRGTDGLGYPALGQDEKLLLGLNAMRNQMPDNKMLLGHGDGAGAGVGFAVTNKTLL